MRYMSMLVLAMILESCDKQLPDPVVPDGGGATCASAAENLISLGCVYQEFEEACESAIEDGRPWPLECIADADTCEAAEACE